MQFLGACEALSAICVAPLLEHCQSEQPVIGSWTKAGSYTVTFGSGNGLRTSLKRLLRDVWAERGPKLLTTADWQRGWKAHWTENTKSKEAVLRFAEAFLDRYKEAPCFLRIAPHSPSWAHTLRRYGLTPVFVDLEEVQWKVVGSSGLATLDGPDAAFEIAVSDFEWNQSGTRDGAQLAAVRFPRRMNWDSERKHEYGYNISVGLLQIEEKTREIKSGDKEWLFRGLLPVNADHATEDKIWSVEKWTVPSIALGAVKDHQEGQAFLHIWQLYFAKDATVRETNFDVLPFELDLVSEVEFAKAACGFSLGRGAS